MINAARLAAVLFCAASLLAQMPLPEPPALRIPRVSRPPRLEDFLEHSPREAEARVTDFRQYEPGDGVPASQPTAAYLSYDDRNLYVVFVCRDEPARIRARLAKREDIADDDKVVVNLDTFHDHRHAYGFFVNPLGVQLDSLWTEAQGGDDTWDTVWHSRGQLTEDGYIVWIAIPFRSLRFPRAPLQNWAIELGRAIPRNNEMSTWPQTTQRIESSPSSSLPSRAWRTSLLGAIFSSFPISCSVARARSTPLPHHPRSATTPRPGPGWMPSSCCATR